jgi:hypothetical protein
MGKQQTRFVFSYREHGPQPPSLAPLKGDDWMREFVRLLGTWEWEQQETAADLSRFCEPDIERVADLSDRVREFLVGELDWPDETVRIPFDKLAALMKGGGWSFVGGDVLEFEGNKSNTEITVVLKPKASRSQGVKRRTSASAEAEPGAAPDPARM